MKAKRQNRTLSVSATMLDGSGGARHPDIYYFRDGPPFVTREVIDAVNIHSFGASPRGPDLVRTERSRSGNYAVVAGDFEAKSHKNDDRGKHEEGVHGRGHGEDHDR